MNEDESTLREAVSAGIAKGHAPLTVQWELLQVRLRADLARQGRSEAAIVQAITTFRVVFFLGVKAQQKVNSIATDLPESLAVLLIESVVVEADVVLEQDKATMQAAKAIDDAIDKARATPAG